MFPPSKKDQERDPLLKKHLLWSGKTVMISSNDSLKLEYIEYQHVVTIFSWHKSKAVSEGDDPSLFGILDREKLYNCLFIPKQQYFGFEYYPTIAAKAAAYFYYLNMYHVFSKANKRVSMSVMETFLMWNDCDLLASDDELYNLALLVANKKTCPRIEVIIQWIEKRIKC